MDESLVDIILILLAGLVAVSIMPQFDVEPPTSVEIDEGAQALMPLQVALTVEGTLLTGAPARTITAETLHELVRASDARQAVELTADRDVTAALVLAVNRVVQRAGREAVIIVRAD